PADGAALSTAAGGYQSGQNIATDGAGGAIVTWEDDFSLGDPNVYAQRVNAAGVVQWTPDGVAICTAVGSQVGPTIVTDGAGGAIVAWQDGSNFGHPNFGDPDTYAQRVNAAGVVQWNADGVLLSAAPSYPGQLSVVPDGAGGAIVSWTDERSGID